MQKELNLFGEFFQPFENISNGDDVKVLLDKSSCVAINHIDLFEEYVIITAKKLHMWDSGL